ncbi:MAG: hypothetical protein EPO00_06545, partial [Chloroflexota bacterium]
LGVTSLAGLIGQLQSDTSGVKLEDVRVARLPDGKDPDEVVRESSADWDAAISKAKPLVEYLVDHHAGRFDLKTSSGRIGFVEAVMPALREIADPLRLDEALGEVRRVSGVEDRVLRQVLERPARNPIRQGRSVGEGSRGDVRISADAVLASPDALPIHDILRAITPVESELLRLLLLVPDLQPRVVDALGPDQLPSTLARELFRAIVLQRAPNDDGIRPAFNWEGLLLGLDPEVRGLAQALVALDRPRPEARELERLLIDIEQIRLRDRHDYNESALAEAEREHDNAAIERLMLEKIHINEQRLSLDRRRDQTRLLAVHRR